MIRRGIKFNVECKLPEFNWCLQSREISKSYKKFSKFHLRRSIGQTFKPEIRDKRHRKQTQKYFGIFGPTQVQFFL